MNPMKANAYNTMHQFTNKELEDELERRKREEKLPKRLRDLDISVLTSCIEEQVKRVSEGDCKLEDFEHTIFELAMEAMYGVKIWSWWNKRV
jgi:hypothetical protein